MNPALVFRYALFGLALLVCLAVAPAALHAESASALWTEATTAAGEGDDAKAVGLLDELAANFPKDSLTDDALYLAGNLLEERLAKPREALIRYQTLLANFPDSRSSLAARRRLERLEAGLGEQGQDAEALIAFQTILRGFPERPQAESIRMAKDLLQAHPNWSQLHEVHLWLAATTRRAGDLDRAAKHYESARNFKSAHADRMAALLGSAEVAILRGDYPGAEKFLEEAAAQPEQSASDGHALEELQGLLTRSRRRSRLLWVSVVAFFAVQLLFLGLIRKRAGSTGQMLKVLRAPTTEFFYMLPGAALLIGLAFTGHQEIGPAVSIICIGGLCTTYLAGVWLEQSAPIRKAHAAIAASASAVAVLGACYLALQRSQLLDLVATTVRFGPE